MNIYGGFFKGSFSYLSLKDGANYLMILFQSFFYVSSIYISRGIFHFIH